MRGLVFGPDGQLYAASAGFGGVLRFNGITGEFIDLFAANPTMGQSLPVTPIFGPNGNLYVGSFVSGGIQQYDATSGNLIGTFASVVSPVALTFTNPARWIQSFPPTTSADPRVANQAYLLQVTTDADVLDLDFGNYQPADLVVTKTDAPDPVAAGGEVTYTITVDNLGPSDATDVTISDPLPAGTSFVSASGGGTFDAVSNSVRWHLGTITVAQAPARRTLVLRVDSNRTTDLSNTVSVFSTTTDLVPSNNSDPETTAVTPTLVDFGDAPATYGNPSHHLAAGPILGTDVDSEAGSQPSGTATGDDNANTDDETGVTFVGSILVGSTANVSVVVSFVGPRGNGTGQTARLDAFLDFNNDGDFADTGEMIFDNRNVSVGTNALSFPVPADADTGFTFARFRVSSEGGLSFDGPSPVGEVEDYRVRIVGAEGGCEDFALDVPETGDGNVSARVSGGILKVRGDVLGNGLVIEAGDGPGAYQISPLGATTINRQFGSVELAGVTRGIQIGLLGGPDVLVLDGSSAELAVTGKLRIRSGTGSTAIIDRALNSFDDHDIVRIVDVLLESGLSVRL